MVLRENECTGEILYHAAAELLSRPEKLTSMRRALAQLAVVDSTERICRTVTELIQSR